VIESANDVANDCTLKADVCIVGSGPAGISLALHLLDTGLEVILLESGGDKEEKDTHALYEGETVDEAMHCPPDKYRQRCFGGSTTIWGGRCVPLDPIDFEERPWIANSGWPISYDEVSPYFGPATRLVEAGENDYDGRTAFGPNPPEMFKGFRSGRVTTDTLERFSVPTDFGARYRHKLAAAKKLRLFTYANAIGIELNDDGSRARAIKVGTLAGKRFRVDAPSIVLATGGLEAPRLLLASREIHPNGIGNAHDVVGRYYQCHIASNVADLRVDGPVGNVRHGYELSPEGVYCRRRMALLPEEQRRLQVGNLAARLHFPNIIDPSHRIGVLSGLYMAKFFISYEYSKRLHGGDRASLARYLGHLRNIVLDPFDTLAFLSHWIRKRTLAVRKFPSVILRNKSNRFSLDLHGEQEPRPESRLTLIEESLDPFGMPRLRIDWRYSQKDIETVRVTLDVIADELKRTGVGTLTYNTETLERDLMRYGAYGGHHIGATRMGLDVRTSVVDPNCQVHGVDGLFVASCSVFPTSSQANPTLTIIALALRLGDHLKRRHLGADSVQSVSIPAAIAATAVKSTPKQAVPRRVLVIGAGGFIGSRLCELMRKSAPECEVVAAVRKPRDNLAANRQIRLEATDSAQVAAALAEADAVINCTAGDSRSIQETTKALFDAAITSPTKPLVVHFSTMAVYGAAVGRVHESDDFQSPIGWYSEAKANAEKMALDFAARGGKVVILRPGIVYGPGSEQWIGRSGRWLRAGRLGDLGPLGDGICNLVHLDDVCAAVLASLRSPEAIGEAFNLATPHPESWNRFFAQLAIAIGATPLKRLPMRQVRLDGKLLGPPLKIGEIAFQKIGIHAPWWPEPITPSVLALWQQEITLDVAKATRILGMRWTPDDVGIRQAADWFLSKYPTKAGPRVV
jgi:choline dehydrogenase-like flavoprotein/nucleoside-diphosphate-sugar epimerase